MKAVLRQKYNVNTVNYGTLSFMLKPKKSKNHNLVNTTDN